MQNASFLDPKTEQFLDDFQRDHDVQLIGIETDEPQYVEALHSWNGHTLGRSEARLNRLTFIATGFIWQHPAGAIVSGEFPKPIKAHEVLMDVNRDELDCDWWLDEVRKAIVAKCGNISGFAECVLN